MALLPVAEAQARLFALAAPRRVEMVPLSAAFGRYAAADIVAKRTQPASDLTAMDGYAIRFADLPGPWRVVGESAAGRAFDGPVGPREAARIFTGAPVPRGADTILIQEEAARDGDNLMLAGEGPPRLGAHVRQRGYDFAEGALLARAGNLLTPARIALAAMGGHGALPVRTRPRVALISTGDELVSPGMETAGAMLPASNGIMLQALIGPHADVIDMGIIPDDLARLTTAFQDAAAIADVVVTTGGASVGDHDLIRPALAAAGATLDFWRIAMRPGKPMLTGQLSEAVMLGLPGNPVAAFVGSHLFLLPLLRHLAGAVAPLPRTERARCRVALPAVGARDDYLRAVRDDIGVRPVGPDDSAALFGLAKADALIIRPAGAPPTLVDESVEILGIA
ncbi:gephyrin-like molybdotransferase Glp [uncultured Sphingomonas sp.]|uniref:molybdopterin molybdotransferase MoeA n=1 Tax=uncultured Sphingomonas sp. TaxID=158754 RepID=UPI0025E044A8|nr:gephyrin-like molybdotransferase Glp [uncultured Sphingomonas sp.]